ncbi:hypothetical protein F2Q69_00019573 [Brassica cretica]|uniref:Uncharacterized protein n=1 Tax=Brassica cretica TaxID=69181 RepID=A0A8S9Q8G7_BRACR|nr:hypothetical protein F2Q69_00019573 [Brassica cretica]
MNLELRHDRDASWLGRELHTSCLGRELAWNANGLRFETRAASIGSRVALMRTGAVDVESRSVLDVGWS